MVSLSIEQTDAVPLPTALPGQFLVLRLRKTLNGPMPLRKYSMSGMPGARTYKVTVKRETNGVVSSHLYDHLHAGDILEVSAPRDGFILRSGDTPVVLLSAGIGVTPVLAMLQRFPPRRHVMRSGGSTERVTARSTRLQKSRMASCKPS